MNGIEFLFVCYLVEFSIWNILMYNELYSIKNDLAAIRRLLENKKDNMNVLIEKPDEKKSCSTCIHNPVCKLWRQEEGQDASNYSYGHDCCYYT